jgi:Domain of unknown function (DUF4296)
MKRLLLLSTAVFMGVACHSGFKPLPPRDLERLLGDINIAETYCAQIRDTVHRESGKNIDSLGYYYQVIMKHYHLTEKELAANIEWCKSHPEELDSVYAKIIVRTVTYQNHMPK